MADVAQIGPAVLARNERPETNRIEPFGDR
jgi:hypothetical protein